MFELAGLPGAELVAKGLDDAENDEQSLEAVLIEIASPRLQRLGIRVRETAPQPELRLFRMLQARNDKTAYRDYNALVRRLISFCQALEREQANAS